MAPARIWALKSTVQHLLTLSGVSEGVLAASVGSHVDNNAVFLLPDPPPPERRLITCRRAKRGKGGIKGASVTWSRPTCDQRGGFGQIKLRTGATAPLAAFVIGLPALAAAPANRCRVSLQKLRPATPLQNHPAANGEASLLTSRRAAPPPPVTARSSGFHFTAGGRQRRRGEEGKGHFGGGMAVMCHQIPAWRRRPPGQINQCSACDTRSYMVRARRARGEGRSHELAGSCGAVGAAGGVVNLPPGLRTLGPARPDQRLR